MTRTAYELAEFLGCSLEGDGAVQLSGVAAPGSAGVDRIDNRHLRTQAEAAQRRAHLPALGRVRFHDEAADSCARAQQHQAFQ